MPFLQVNVVKDAYSMRLKLDTVQLIRRRVILMSVVSGKGPHLWNPERRLICCVKSCSRAQDI